MAIFLVLILIVPGDGSGLGSAASTVNSEPDPANEEIEVEVGHEVAITIESNPSTGYQWNLAWPVDGEVLQFIGSEYLAGEGMLPGAGGKERGTFRAVGRGATKIILEYIRAWERGEPAARRRTIAVYVR